MALTSTLYTGLSGMNVNQQRLNVIGNNIANVNTVAFKSSRALFKPQFYVSDSTGSAASSEFGGTNPSQRGMGVQMAAIEKNFSAGAIETTGVQTDMAIDGDGFFVVNDGNANAYTRDGSFERNSNNQLVTASGDYVQGYGVDKNFNIIPNQLSKLTIPLGSMTIAEATSNVQMQGNLNANGELGMGASVLQSQALLDNASNPPTDTTALLDLRLASDTTTPIFADGQVLTVEGKRGGNNLPPETMTVGPTTTVADLNAFFQKGMTIDTSSDVVASAPAAYVPGAALSTTTLTGDPAGSLRLNITGNVGTANALTLPAPASQPRREPSRSSSAMRPTRTRSARVNTRR